MSAWEHEDYEAAKRACWGDDEWHHGVDLCLEQIRPMLFALHADQATPRPKVLEVGSGVGRLLLPLARDWPMFDFVGLDSSASMHVHAYAQLVEKRSWLQNVRLCFGSYEQLAPPTVHNFFDGAYSVVVFQHLDHATQAAYLDALGFAIRPGGRLRLQWVCEGDEGPLNHPTPAPLMAAWLGAAGFDVEAIEHGLAFPTWSWVSARRR